MDTTIEWLELQFEKYTRGGVQVPNEKIFKLTEKAKQKEKEQIIKAYLKGDSNGCGCYDYATKEDAEEYYNQTFNK